MNVAVRQNITLSLDKRDVQQAKVLAAKRGVSMSGLLASEIERLANEERTLSRDYQRAMRQSIALMEKGFKLGRKPLIREQANKRKAGA